MSTTSIKVQYVNPPKSPKGPGNVKTDEGVYYKVWPKAKDGGATLSQFEVGRTYEIEYDTEKYNGEDRFTARKILSSSESVVTQASNGHAPVAATGNGREARIERQSAQKVAIQFLALEVQASGVPVTLERLFELTDAIAADIDNTGKVKPESSNKASEPEVEI